MNQSNIVEKPFRYAGKEETEYWEDLEDDECPECGDFLQGGEIQHAHEAGAGDGHAEEPAFLVYDCEGCGRTFLQKFEPVGAANLTEIENSGDE